MTPAELRSVRQALGLSAEGFAHLVRFHSGRSVRRWERGDVPIPGAVEVIARMAAALQHAGAVEPQTYLWEISLAFDCGEAVREFTAALEAFR